jgi:PAS domain S-box-containing protein
MAESISISASGWVAARDMSGLQEIVQAQHRHPETEFVMLLDSKGQVLAHSDRSRIGQYVRDLPTEAKLTVLDRSTALVDVVAPVVMAGRFVGWARIGMGHQDAATKLDRITRNGLLYALAAIVVGAIMAGFMGTRIMANIYAIRAVSNAVQSGRRDSRVPPLGENELGQLGVDFNEMLDGLSQRERAIELLNAKLMESEEKYRTVADFTYDWEYWQAPDGSLLYVSPACERLSGYRAEEFQQDPGLLTAIAHPEDRKQVEDHMLNAGNTATEQNRQELDFRILTRGGEERWIAHICQQVHGRDGKYLGRRASNRDITRRKRAEEALQLAFANLERIVTVRTEELQQSNEDLKGEVAERRMTEESLQDMQRRLTTLMGNLPGMAYRCRNDRHWTMEFVSDGCLALTGHPIPHLIDNAELSFEDIIHPDCREAVWTDVQKALDQKLRFELTYRIQTTGGEVKWVWEQGMGVYSPDGAVLALEGFIIDITIRQAAQDTMIKYQQLSEHARDIILFVRLKDGGIVEANQAACAAYGCGRAELLAHTVYDLQADSPDLVSRQMGQASQSDSVFETIYKRRDGRTFPVEVSSCAAQINGETLLLNVVRDITERKRAEHAVLESLREKESLLKEIHHRVKNNLQIVSSLLRLQWGQIDHPIAKAAMQDMQNRVHSMALIHEHLYRSENLAQVDMAAYLRSLCPKLLRTLAARPDAIELHLDLIPVHLEIDQAIPCGLLVNELVSNALKHAFPAGRTGVVRVELQPLDGGRLIHLRIRDNGVGLPADFDIERLSSLGLELASDLASQLRGELKIGPGPGATFDVVFKPAHRMDSTRNSGDMEIRRREIE